MILLTCHSEGALATEESGWNPNTASLAFSD